MEIKTHHLLRPLMIRLIKQVWISYMGDSLARDLFYNSVQRISGYEYGENWLNDSYLQAPLLGPHIGPMWDHAIDRSAST